MRAALIFAVFFLGTLAPPAQAKRMMWYGFDFAQSQGYCARIHRQLMRDMRDIGIAILIAPGHHLVQRVGDPRPRAWCGWFFRHRLGVADRRYNLARAWAGYGSPASGPAPGVVAVYPHHVGLITGVPGPGRIVMLSGNDGRRVRERERSTRGVIAYRWPGARVASRN
jgi:hypothetical protein